MFISHVYLALRIMVGFECGSASWEARTRSNSNAAHSCLDDLENRPVEAPYKFLIEEEDFCHRYPGLYIIAYVFSTISEVDKRRTTRDTWATPDMYNKYGIKMATVFVVGRSKNETEERILRRESQLYHDMIQGDFEDTYHMLTYKGLASLVWITRHCSFVPWILHADDDVFVDLWIVHQKMKKFERDQMPSQFYCNPLRNQKVRRKGKWEVSYEVIPDERYPDYCHGPTWFIPADLAPRLLDASRRVNYFWVDDVYLTGYVAREAGLGPPTDIVARYYGNRHTVRSELGRMFAWHRVYEDRLEFWKFILANHTAQIEN